MTKTQINKMIRRALRLICFVIIATIAVFRMIIPYTQNLPIYLDRNDGYIILGCLSILTLCMNTIRGILRSFLNGIVNKLSK